MFHVCGTNKYSSPAGTSPIYFNCMEIANERKTLVMLSRVKAAKQRNRIGEFTWKQSQVVRNSTRETSPRKPSELFSY